MKNKKLSWEWLFGIAVASLLFKYFLGGVIGDCFGILGTITFLLGLADFIPYLKNQSKKKEVDDTESKPATKTASLIIGVAVFVLVFGVSYYMTTGSIPFVQKKAPTTTRETKALEYFTDNSEWKEFNSTVGQFKATFPSYPTHESTPMNVKGFENVSLENYTANDADGNYYTVGYSSYPSSVDVSNPKNNLEGALNGTLIETDTVLVSSEFSSFKGYPVLNYVAKSKDGEYVLKGRYIMLSLSLYTISGVGETANEASLQYDRFVASFDLQ